MQCPCISQKYLTGSRLVLLMISDFSVRYELKFCVAIDPLFLVVFLQTVKAGVL